jgi:amino acid transporter
LVIAGAGFVSTENLRWISSPTVANIGTASLLLFFAFLGLETPLSNGGEIKNPKRTVPLGVLFGIAIVAGFIMSIPVGNTRRFGLRIAAHKDAPLAAVAGIIFGKAGTVLIITAIAISMLGSLSGEILSIPRILFAGARDGLMPKPFAKVHPRFFTPHIAVAFYAGLGFVFSVTGGFKQLATLTSASLLMIYLGVVLATIKLRKKNNTTSEKTFRVPGGMIVPLTATAGILWLLSGLTKQELTDIAIFIMVFSLIYLIVKQLKKK